MPRLLAQINIKCVILRIQPADQKGPFQSDLTNRHTCFEYLSLIDKLASFGRCCGLTFSINKSMKYLGKGQAAGMSGPASILGEPIQLISTKYLVECLMSVVAFIIYCRP